MSNERDAPLPRTVVGLGLVSFLTDVSGEAAFPLVPAFLVSLGAGNWFVGLVEGCAELVASVLKYLVGLRADRVDRLKPLVLGGYTISTLMRPLLAVAAAPWHVLVIRSADRVGKGIRTTPRDTMIAAATPPAARGRAFGFHQAMDHAGAAVGTGLAALALWWLGDGTEAIRSVFLWAAVPGVLAVLAVALTPEAAAEPRPRSAISQPMPPELRRVLVAFVLFGLARGTDAFLLVQAARLGAPPTLAPILWLAIHVVRAGAASVGGGLADRVGRRRVLLFGWCGASVAWAAVGITTSIPVLFALGTLHGVCHGVTDGAERALVADLSGGAKGKAFGIYNMILGLAALVSSTAFGWVWDRWGSAAAFSASAVLALGAAAALRRLAPAR